MGNMHPGNSASNLREPALQTPQIDKICKHAINAGASDIHIIAGKPPTLRINGNLQDVETRKLTTEDTHNIVRALTAGSGHLENALSEEGGVDFSFSMQISPETTRAFRVNIVKADGTHSITMRLISNVIPTPTQIGLKKELIELIDHGSGILLVTGATGSGKSTTMASLIQSLANRFDRKIVTVEQPIEYRFQHGKSIVVQQEVPIHNKSFDKSLRFMLRSDPDVIMVGELRELEEIKMALHAAESGHLVISTVHTSSAADSINRIVDVFPPEEQQLVRVMLSQTLLGVISQDLLPTVDGTGRVLAYELMVRTPAISNLIREGKTERILGTMQTSANQGMHTFDSYLVKLVADNKISRTTAIQYARDKEQFAKSLVDHMRRSENMAAKI